MFEYELMNVVERINAVDVGEGAGRRGAGRRAGGVYLKIDTKKGRGGEQGEKRSGCPGLEVSHIPSV